MRLNNQSYISRKTEFATTDGRTIQFFPGKGLHYEFELNIRPDENWSLPTDVIEHQIWLPDAQGQIWTTATYFTADYLVDELARASFDARYLSYFDEADEETRSLFESALVLEGVRCSNDDRFYRSLWLGEERVEFLFKYTVMFFDIAVKKDLSLGMRLYAKLREECLSSGWLNGEPLPAILFEMSHPATLLRMNTAFYNEEEGCWQDSSFSIPLIFASTDQTDAPQSNVSVA